MKAWIVTVTFKNGEKEGVLFTEEDNAWAAYRGDSGNSSSLVYAWNDIYRDDGLPIHMQEIEL